MMTKSDNNACLSEAPKHAAISKWSLLIALVIGSMLAVQSVRVYAAPQAPPIAVPDDRLNQVPGVPVVVEVLANDIDNDIATDSVRIIDPADLSGLLTSVVVAGEGRWQVNTGNGTITYTPCSGAGQPVAACTGAFNDDPLPMEYNVSDSQGSRSNPAIITITIDPDATLPPAIRDDVASTVAGQAVIINVLTNDDDPDGVMNPSSVTVTGQPGNGSAAPNDNGNGTIIYTPNGGFSGPDQFTYRACNTDSTPQCDTANVFVTVTTPAPNQPPVVVNDSPPAIVFGQTTTLYVLANDYDPDGELDVSSVNVIVWPGHGIATPTHDSQGSVTYTPANGYSGSDQFRYQVCDDGASSECGTATVFLTVLPPPNQKPIANDDLASTLANQPVQIAVLTNDVDVDGSLDPTSLTIKTPADNGSTALSNGIVTYSPSHNFSGNDSFVYQVCDSATTPACDRATVSITVIEPSVDNEAYAIDDTAQVAAGQTVIGNVLDNDLDPEDDGWQAPAIKSQPTWGAVELGADGVFTYTADASFLGEDGWSYRVCDLGSPEACDDADVIVTVSALNQPPQIQNDAAVTRINKPVSGNLLVNDSDPDGDFLTVTVTPTTAPGAGQVKLSPNGHYTYTPQIDVTGLETFAYQACDPKGLCDIADVKIDVRALNMANAAPFAVDDRSVTRPGTAVDIVALANDGDLDGAIDAGSVSVVTPPTQGHVIVAPDGVVTYTPTAEATDSDLLHYRVCDNGEPILCAFATVTIDIVTDEVNATYAFDDVAWGRGDQPLQGNVLTNDIDLEGDQQTVDPTPATEPSHGQLTLSAGGAFSYSANVGYVGTDQFTYNVCDDGAPQACAVAAVSLHIFPPNLGWDFGDALGYPTSLTTDGARHAIVANLSLGDAVDPEADGLLNGAATGDDETDLDDEHLATVFPNYDGSGSYHLDVPVTNRTPYPAQLAGWIDWNVNSSFDDPGELSRPALAGDGVTAPGSLDDSFTTANVPPGFSGVVTLTWESFTVPGTASPSKYVRLRLAGDLPGSEAFFTDAGPPAIGPATGGSVIDMLAPISTQRVLVDSFTAVPTAGNAADDSIDFAWITALEDGVEGFNILVEQDGELVVVNSELIPSKVTSSTTATDYTYVATVEGDVFYLQTVMLSGETLLYGPARLGIIRPASSGYYLPMILRQ